MVLVVLSTRPRQVIVYVVETVDASLLEDVSIEGYDKKTRERIRAVMLRKITPRCGAAFDNGGLRSPEQQIREGGIVIQPSKYLFDYNPRSLNLVSEKTLESYKDEFSRGRSQAGTVPHMRSGQVLTLDGREHIYLHPSAFLGDSFLAVFFGWVTLDDVITHELIHSGGQLPTPGFWGSLQDDLAGYEHYDAIMEACR
jgi:hypothetical protein